MTMIKVTIMTTKIKANVTVMIQPDACLSPVLVDHVCHV